jgi:CRISPR-associated protein Cmr2
VKEEENMTYLMVIGVGPVQEFITSARRSRDLWLGSWLLSEISKAAAKKIADECGLASLIFPSIENDEDLKPVKSDKEGKRISGTTFNVVNKIVALVKLVEKPDILGEAIYEAMQKRLGDIREDAYKKITENPKYNANTFFEEKAIKQVNNLVEFFWTAVKIANPDDASEYQEARTKVEYLFAARKATRNFISTIAWSGNVPKSSLDGQRESVINDKVFNEVSKGGLSKEELRKQFGVREGERLCGVGLLKRHGNRKGDDSFFSTSHVASLPFLERVKKQNEPEKIKKYIDKIKSNAGLSEKSKDSEFYKLFGCVPKELEHEISGRYDGHLFFAERLNDFFDDQEKVKASKAALRKLLDEVIGKGKEPLPYYALLLADGDNMGKAIDKQAEKGKTAHQKLSANLSKFAGEAQKIIEGEKQGSLIYAGGDDVLAFVALHKVLEYAEKLSLKFQEILAEFKFDSEKSPTLSVGIAVAHHLEPLEDALELARKAEKAAKAVDGKNALAVIVNKRSGASRTLKGRWGTIDKRLGEYVKWHQDKEALSSAAYQLRDLANRLEVSDKVSNEDKEILQRAKVAEAKRILERKEISEEALREVKTFLHDIRDVLKKEHLAKGKDEKDFVDQSVEILAEELIIAKIFADAKNLAGEKDE